MGQQEVQNVLNSIMFRQQQGLAEQKQLQDKTQSEAENKLKQEQIDQATDRLQQEQRQFDLTHKATQALNNLEVQQRQQAINQGQVASISQGLPVQGDTILSSRQVDSGEKDASGKPIIDTYNKHSIANPTGDPFEFEMGDAQTLARLQSKKNLAVQLPEIRAKAQAEMEKMQDELINKRALQQEHDTAEAKWHAATDRTRLAVAQLTHAKGIADFDPTPWLNGLANGTYTRDDIIKSFPKDKDLATTILNSAAKSGMIPLSKEQKTYLTKFGGAADVLDLQDQFLQKLPDQGVGTSNIRGMLNGMFNPDLVNLEKEMQGRATPIARGLAQESRTSNPEINRVMGGYIPSRYDTKDAAVKKRNDFQKDLIKGLRRQFPTMSPYQLELIKKENGLSGIDRPYNALPQNQDNQPADPSSVFNQYGITLTGK